MGVKDKEKYLYFLGREIVNMPVELALGAFRICLQPVGRTNVSVRIVSSMASIWGADFVPQCYGSAQHHFLSLPIPPIIWILCFDASWCRVEIGWCHKLAGTMYRHQCDWVCIWGCQCPKRHWNVISGAYCCIWDYGRTKSDRCHKLAGTVSRY